MNKPVAPGIDHLMRVQLEVEAPRLVGDAPLGNRKFVAIRGGEFSGEKLKGKVLPGGGDWLLQRGDDCTQVDARYILETDKGELIYLCDRGFRHGPEGVMRRLAQGENVNPADYYFRTSAQLETASRDYAWLNRTVVIGSGARGQHGVTIDFFTVS